MSSSSSHSFLRSSISSSSEDILGKYVSSLYKCVTGKEISDRELCEAVSSLAHVPESSTAPNETRYVEKLKLHLIHQNRHSESKRFVELSQKLKGMPLLKNREGILALLYELFDKEPTRLAIQAKRASSRPNHGSATNGSSSSTVSPRDIHSGVAMARRVEPLRPKTQPSSYSDADETLILGRDDNSNPSFDPVGPTPMPNLSFVTDRSLRDKVHRSQSSVPLLSMPVSENNQGTASSRRKEDFGTPPPEFGHVGRRGVGNNMEKVLMNGNGPSGPLLPSKVIAFPVDHGKQLLSGQQGSSLMTQSTTRSGLQLGHESRTTTLGQSVSQRGGSRFFVSSRQFEKELIRDLIFVFQGIDGAMIKCDSKGNFNIFTEKQVHPGLRQQTLRLAELGFFYKQIRTYCLLPIVGLMAQGLKHALDLEIQEYYRLLAIVQGQVQATVVDLVDTPMSESGGGGNSSGEEMTLLKLTVWMFDVRPRLDALSGIISSCGVFKGGELCSMLYKYSLHGDPMIRGVTNSLLSTTAKPLYLMLCQWILYGELEDPYEEFFIAADVSCKREQLWNAKYHIRTEMLPSFISVKQAEKILATGKNINFLKDICQNTQGYEGRGQIKSWLEKSPVDCMFTEDDKVLNTAIDKAYKTTSQMVLEVLIQESKLIDHLKAIKHYLLLGQGDFIQHLLELIQEELSKPGNKLYSHNISAILESATRATNAQFEPEDILCRLDTRILPASDKDLGWDVFCLDYKVHGPIGTVLTEDVMIRYNQLFNALWRFKRIEMILNTLWKDQTALFKFQRVIPELGPVLHRSQLLISEMIHFVHQTQYYIMFEATECAWDRLMEEVNKAVDLDEVISAHSHFLESITSRSLLDRENRELLNQLRGIFDSVHELKSFLHEFESVVEKELQVRRQRPPSSAIEEDRMRKDFFSNYIRSAKGKIETLYTTTQDLVRSFLLVLNRQPDLTLQCLSFRLDFNEYYHFKDFRLSQPLTFQSRRMSSNTFDPTNMHHAASGLNQSLFNSASILESFSED